MNRIIQYLFLSILSVVFLSCDSGKKNGSSSDLFNESLSDTNPGIWQADNGDGTYKNPILFADYSDPDVVKVGSDYYMTASSFNCIPGLPILHSKDLVNWELIAYAVDRLHPEDEFDSPQHGNGIWAPSIRYHKGEYYIYYGDPDYGIHMVKASNPKGPWAEPILVEAGKGLIDPCPLWDDDGKVYLVHAFAGSRAGTKSILVVKEMNAAGTKTLDRGVLVFDGHEKHVTVEGPKFYKHNNEYYIFAPAGGVTYGWQLVLRSKNIYGPYEAKVVMHQGNTDINGPHQGGWVETNTGESWFIHFQDRFSYGRVVHLQPMTWNEGWPLIGIDQNNDGIGEPVASHKKPDVGGAFPTTGIPVSDEFNTTKIGLQWQWHANVQGKWGFPTGQGFYRLNARLVPENTKNLWDVPNLLLQKFPGPEFSATTKITYHLNKDGEKVGLLVMGRDYFYLSVVRQAGVNQLVYGFCKEAEGGEPEIEQIIKELPSDSVFLRVQIDMQGKGKFGYSENGKKYQDLEQVFTAREGKWIGAKVGLFSTAREFTNNGGYSDIDWFRVE
jgi:beta-xylosidase